MRLNIKKIFRKNKSNETVPYSGANGWTIYCLK